MAPATHRSRPAGPTGAGGLPDDRQLAGLDDSHLVPVAGGGALHPAAAAAFAALCVEARAAGFDLAVASAWRGYARQLAIWNGKLAGERSLHDDRGRPLALRELAPREQLAAVLRFSALPGTSRHHWGTDLDIYDASALPAGQKPALTPAEVAPGGVFDPLHSWLDERMAAGGSHGFYRPYAVDRGGVAPERWHLSYAPLARHLAPRLTVSLLVRAWDEGGEPAGLPLLLNDLPALLARYVAVPGDWAPL
ncbi:M15 family metallopeptidase [Pseudohaliea rubra]|nr:M15 family metallopeptidase [Pseudohaliea rubra]